MIFKSAMNKLFKHIYWCITEHMHERKLRIVILQTSHWISPSIFFHGSILKAKSVQARNQQIQWFRSGLLIKNLLRFAIMSSQVSPASFPLISNLLKKLTSTVPIALTAVSNYDINVPQKPPRNCPCICLRRPPN